MTTAALARAKEIQQQLVAHQLEVHAELVQNVIDTDKQRQKVYNDRDLAIQKLVDEKKVTQPFWANVIIACLTKYDVASAANTHFLGPYDAELLRAHLTQMHVEHKEGGATRLSLTFTPNPFFEETVLWAEMTGEQHPAADGAAEDEEDEEDEGGQWVFSGITWKDGHGPEEDDEGEEEEEEEGSGAQAPAAAGRKRPREEEGDNDAKASASPRTSTTQGPSMLEVFGVMPPHPTRDDELLEMLENEDEEGEEELEGAVEEWEMEMEDRERLLMLLLQDLYPNPEVALVVEQL